MKRHLMLTTALPSMQKIAFTFLCCTLVILFAAPVWAQGDQCSGALPLSNPGPLPGTVSEFPVNVTGCGVLITVDPTGAATITIPGNNNPYDGTEDTLVGIQNNSGGSFASITLSSSTPIFAFDADGPCTQTTHSSSCPFPGTTGYEGPNNTFTNISADHTSGTVTFTTPIPTGGSTWFALEGAPQTITVGAISQTQTLTFACASYPCNNVPQQATDNCGGTNESTGACTNPDASSIKLTFDTVNSEFQVQVTFTEVDGDGVCLIPSTDTNANDSADFDCTWANFFGSSKPSYSSFPYLFTMPGTVNVPYCLHYARGGKKCVDINAELLDNAEPGNQFSGSIQLYVAWNEPTTSLFPPIGGPWGSDNTVSPRFYDAPHDDSDTVDYAYPKPTGYPYGPPSDQQKVFDITGYFNPLGQAGVDGGIGTTKPAGGKTLNHFAVAFPLAPPDTAELLFPLQKKPDPACFIKGLPMPVLFEIENTNTDKFDPNALKAPNYARITVLQGTIPVLAPVLGQILPVPFLQLYAAALSNANLTTSTSNATTLYQLQIQSNLAAKPLTKNFVVKKSCP
jgi:hypothetical protein